MTIDFDPAQVRTAADLNRIVAQAFEAEPFPGEYGLRLLEDVSIGDFYCTTIYAHHDQLHAEVHRWTRNYDKDAHDLLLDISRMNRKFSPLLVSQSTTLTAAEAEYFPGFLDELLTIHEGQILEPVVGMVLDGAGYLVQLYRDGERQREFRWHDSSHRTRGLMRQLMRLTEHVYPRR